MSSVVGQVGRGKVADDGTCTATGAKLRSIDLTPEERESLAAGIAKLATEREHAERFEKFGECPTSVTAT